MSELTDVTQAFTKSGIVGKILITFSIFLVLFLTVFVWYNVQNNKLIVGIQTLIEDQAQLEVFKRCIKKSYDEALYEYNEKLLPVLGETLQLNNVQFPQNLNTTILKFQSKLGEIQDCLIFPEDLK